MWVYRAKVRRVVDADTIDVTIDLGFGVYKQERLRLARIDAWETRGRERKRGLAAKAYVERLLPEGAIVELESKKGKSRGKYGRFICEVVVHPDEDDSFNLNSDLLEEDHAVLYGKK